MIVDTSAVIAILRLERDSRQFAEALFRSDQVRMSAATYLEAGVIVDHLKDPRASRLFDSFLRQAGVEIVPVTATHAVIAREAYRDFGKGSGHPAGLNYGDCFSYALAKDLDDSLLYKGDDFAHTDVRNALQ